MYNSKFGVIGRFKYCKIFTVESKGFNAKSSNRITLKITGKNKDLVLLYNVLYSLVPNTRGGPNKRGKVGWFFHLLLENSGKGGKCFCLHEKHK